MNTAELFLAWDAANRMLLAINETIAAVQRTERIVENVPTETDAGKLSQTADLPDNAKPGPEKRLSARRSRGRIAAGDLHTLGLRADGSIVAVGNNSSRQCEVSEWNEIMAVAAGSNYSVGLRADGSVVAVGRNSYGRCDISDWTLN